MKTIKMFILTVLLLLFCITACQKAEDPIVVDKFMNSVIEKIELEPYVPPLKTRSSLRNATSTNEELDKLGFGFNTLGEYPLVNPRNITYSILDTDKIYNDPTTKSRISITKIYESNSNFNSFSSSEEYLDNQKKNFNLSIDGETNSLFNLVKINFKTKYGFMTENIDQSTDKEVFGEIEVGIIRKKLSINIIDGWNNIMLYVDPSFKEDYYYLPERNLVNAYGSHVLVNYFTGGKLFATYRGTTKDKYEKSYKKQLFEASMRASFGNILGEAKVGFETDFTDESDNENRSKYSKFEVAYRSFGGNPGLAVPSFVGPGVPENINVDLSGWGSSAASLEYSTLQEIGDGGLDPIYKYMIEDNLKKRYYHYLKVGWRVDMVMPRFYLIEGAYGYDTYIVTKYQDLICISRGRLCEEDNCLPGLKPESVGNFPIYPIENQVMKITRGPIYYGSNKDLDRDLIEQGLPDGSTLLYEVSDVNKNSIRLCKVNNDESQMRYILLSSNGNRFAFSLLGEEAELLYGLDISNLVVENIDFSTLRNYTIIAL